MGWDVATVRLSRGLCATVADVIHGSHKELNALFLSAGAPQPAPDLPHELKWKTWLFQCGQAPDVDALRVLGNILEEFMDFCPFASDAASLWRHNRQRVVDALAADGLEYFRGGRIVPNGASSSHQSIAPIAQRTVEKPKSVEELLSVVTRGLPRAMYPLVHRRKGATPLSFNTEYDVQDLLHALLRPWIEDIRAEEFTPSYAGSSTRMDFLLPEYGIVIETKIVRDKNHAKQIGKELIIDMDHYGAHPECRSLWCVVFDPSTLVQNPAGLKRDVEGPRTTPKGSLSVRLDII